MKYDEKQLARLRELGERFEARVQKARERQLKAAPAPHAALMRDVLCRTEQSELWLQIRADLAAGKRPSEVVEARLGWLFEGFIFPQRRACVLYAVDKAAEWNCLADLIRRRSFRSSAPEALLTQMSHVLAWFIWQDVLPQESLALLRGELSEEERGYVICRGVALPPCQIAYEIDRGHEAFVEELCRVIRGEAEQPIDAFIIRGILQSSHAELHALLGRLLLAARLQEGLRQAICENADMGTVAGFLEILRVIREHELIRFSSVRRALGVWTGVLADLNEARSLDSERIARKTLELVWNALSDADAREAYLASGDAMQIYLALWALAVREMRDALSCIRRISAAGSHHQLLAACYALPQFCQHQLAHRLAAELLERHREQDILAVVMDSFMPKSWYSLYEQGKKCVRKGRRVPCPLGEFFADRAEAERYFDILAEVLAGIRGKGVTFDPCIFPWHKAALNRRDIVVRLGWIASALEDDARIDVVLDHLDAAESFREELLPALLSFPQTAKQKRVLVERVGDKMETVRRQAWALVKKLELDAVHYRLLEDMLRYKNADIREKLICLLLGQVDDALHGSVARLLADKKEEKRSAGLDIVLRLGRDKSRQELHGRCARLVAGSCVESARERMLVEQIVPSEAAAPQKTAALYGGSETYVPVVDKEYLARAGELFRKYFYHQSLLDNLRGREEDFARVNQKLLELMKAHEHDEYTDSWGDTMTLGTGTLYWRRRDDGSCTMPLADLWDAFYAEEVGSPVLLMRAFMSILSEGDYDECSVKFAAFVKRHIGEEFTRRTAIPWQENVARVYEYLLDKFAPEDELRLLASWVAWQLAQEERLCVKYSYRNRGESTKRGRSSVLSCAQFELLLSPLRQRGAEDFEQLFPICARLQQVKDWNSGDTGLYARGAPFYSCLPGYGCLTARDYVRAAHAGLISEEYMYRSLMEPMEEQYKNRRDEVDALHYLSCVAKGGCEAEELAKTPGLLPFALRIGEQLLAAVLDEELRRGDSQTRYSRHVFRIAHLSGAGYYVRILTALGRQPLSRKRGQSWSRDDDNPARECLSHLLEVCVPGKEDSAASLGALLAGTDICPERLVEAAMYSPEWLKITEEYLGWAGLKSACYYFLAHTSAEIEPRREAVIARYSPLSKEELNGGAFDLNWFRSAYAELGEKRFDLVYKAARYCADGARHTRARKYADAATGRLSAGEARLAIAEKRNKDLLMAWGLIPLKDEAELLERYLGLQQFLRESRQFGAQRMASEKLAVEMALRNLATNAGCEDVTRLFLRMETRLLESTRPLLEESALGEYRLRLVVDERGRTDILCTKDGKALKAVPARLKKEAFVQQLHEKKKQFNEQQARTRQMLEQSMEEGTEYRFGELVALLENPVAAPMLRALVFARGEGSGYLVAEGLRTPDGCLCPLGEDECLRVAHPMDLYTTKSWGTYQRDLFSRGVVQPFRQVFRELYVKTAEEEEMIYSLRYAGHQIQPGKALACLKSRRWVADAEAGIQKVCYRENIVARIYALADWFSPSDIEAPMLEWVCFHDRRTGEPLPISRVPARLFSEVMRDVDLAVSVAHAGGVDPETSHSTIEMRAALLRFTLPLFKLSNVEIQGRHAHISGSRADYTLHLGSGVVHQKGGTMLNILPVHSQHRGRLFLPFADDDPRTAEILSKVLLLAEDAKLQDPTILGQLNQGR